MLILLLIAAGAAAIVALAIDDGKGTGKRAASSAASGGTQSQGARRTTSSTAQTHPTRNPFDVGNVRYAVFVAPHQGWTQFTQQAPTAPGKRWLLISVRTRNLGRTGFDPLKLPYSVSEGGQGGTTYAPDPRYGSGPQLHARDVPLAVNGLTQTQLAFLVPATARNLRLHFTAGPGHTQPIEVPVDHS